MAAVLTIVGQTGYSQASLEDGDQYHSESSLQVALGLSSRLDVEEYKDLLPWPSLRLYWFQGSTFAWAAGISHTRQTGIRFLDKLSMDAIMFGGRIQTNERKIGGFAEAYYDIRRYNAEYQGLKSLDTTHTLALVLGAYYRFSPRLAADLSWHGVFGRPPDNITFSPESGEKITIDEDAYNPDSIEIHVRIGF
jgi:hypothetical protein